MINNETYKRAAATDTIGKQHCSTGHYFFDPLDLLGVLFTTGADVAGCVCAAEPALLVFGRLELPD